MRIQTQRRGGAVVVESAFVMPVALTVIVAIVAGALAVATYQQVAAMSREAARYASVHGYEYSQSTGNAAATQTSIYNNVIQPRLINMDPNNVNFTTQWSPDNRQGSTVICTMTYTMSVPIYGTMTFTSTSKMTMTW